LSFLSRKPLTAARAARIIAFVTVSITVVSGVVIHFLDRANFPDIGAGMWWAVQTVTTVGYGDAVPTSTGGRLVATLVMVLGIGFLTVVTAAITSTFVEAARGRMRAGESEPLEAKLDRISARLDAIEAKLAEITPEGR
jgi:voltage-gated potassium channel